MGFFMIGNEVIEKMYLIKSAIKTLNLLKRFYYHKVGRTIINFPIQNFLYEKDEKGNLIQKYGISKATFYRHLQILRENHIIKMERKNHHLEVFFFDDVIEEKKKEGGHIFKGTKTKNKIKDIKKKLAKIGLSKRQINKIIKQNNDYDNILITIEYFKEDVIYDEKINNKLAWLYTSLIENYIHKEYIERKERKKKKKAPKKEKDYNVDNSINNDIKIWEEFLSYPEQKKEKIKDVVYSHINIFSKRIFKHNGSFQKAKIIEYLKELKQIQ